MLINTITKEIELKDRVENKVANKHPSYLCCVFLKGSSTANHNPPAFKTLYLPPAGGALCMPLNWSRQNGVYVLDFACTCCPAAAHVLWLVSKWLKQSMLIERVQFHFNVFLLPELHPL